MELAKGDYVVLLEAGDRLATSALLRLADQAANHAAAILYGDEDHAGPRGRRTPWFKPAWNEEMFLALDLLSGTVALRRDVALAAARDLSGHRPLSPADALLPRAGLLAKKDVTHLPRVLAHCAGEAKSSPHRAEEIQALLGTNANVAEGPFGTARVSWPLPTVRPVVSLVIPTRDRVELLRACVGSVLAKTDYAPFELVIVDNGSRDPETLAYLDELGLRKDVTIVRSEAPFNFSALCNLGARASRGAYLLFLNNDTEVIGGDWLSEMMRHAVRPEVGAVGAKLLYDDHTIQHAGVMIGLGEAAGHGHRFLPDCDPGYFRQAHVAQQVSAVTAACLLVARAKFAASGGFDEEHFAIAYNDVDLCLRLQEAGWRNIYTPHAILYHHESKSRGDDLSPVHRERYMAELAALQERWGTKTYRDPLHSPNLDRYNEIYIPLIEIDDYE